MAESARSCVAFGHLARRDGDPALAAGAPLANTRDGGSGDREGGDGAEGKSRARQVVTGARERAQRLGLLGGVVGVGGRLLLNDAPPRKKAPRTAA